MNVLKSAVIAVLGLAGAEALTLGTPMASFQSAFADAAADALPPMIKALQANPAPGPLTAPFGYDEADAWVQSAADAKTTAKDAMKKLEALGPSITDPAVLDKANKTYAFASGMIDETDAAVGETISTLRRELYQRPDMDQQMKWLSGRDPENPNHAANVFLHPVNAEQNLKMADDRLAVVLSAKHLSAAFGKPPSDKLAALIEETTTIRDTFAKGIEVATANQALPKPKSNDPEQIEIAKAILAKPKYEFGEHGPIILTTKEIVTREKVVNRDTIKDFDVSLSGDVTFTGERETWTYKWDEFRFATPIKDDGETWHIYWITAKKFESGWAKTPIGEWVSGKVVKGVAIPEDKFR